MVRTERKSRLYTQIVFLINGVLYFLAFGSGYVIVSVITGPVANDIGSTEGFISYWGGIQIGLMCSMGPVATALLRRFGIKTLGIVCGLMASVSYILTCLARDKWVFAMATCIYGVSMGTLFTSMFVTATHVFPSRFSQVNSLFLAASGFAIGSSYIIQILVNNYGWRGAILVLAAVYLNLPVFSLLLKKDIGKHYEPVEPDINSKNPDDNKKLSSPIINVFKRLHLDVFQNNLPLVVVFVSGICAGVGNATCFLFMIPYAVSIGIDPTDASALTLSATMICFIIRFSFSFVNNNNSISNVVKMFAVAQLAEFLSFLVFVCWHSLPMLHVAAGFHGIAMGSQYYSVVTLAAMFATKEEYVDYSIGWCVSTEGLGALLTAFIGLYISSYYVGFQVCFGVQALSIPLMIYLLKVSKND